ncbi:COQ9 family protein [Rhodovibrio salinarum]|nr:COQ9 family protein [Rhodovibrio salinarum]
MRDLDELRREIMQRTLENVPFDGWSWASINAAADELGIDRREAESAFPGGPAEVIELHSMEADYAMLAAFEEQAHEGMRVREQVARAIWIRLEQNEPHREAVRRALSFLALPQHHTLALRLLYRTCDAVWTAAGDGSADYNFYTKRGLLSGVYSSTLLYWLEDSSEDYTATKAFLDRRIDETVQIGGRLGRAIRKLEQVPKALRYIFPSRGGEDLRMRGN